MLKHPISNVEQILAPSAGPGSISDEQDVGWIQEQDVLHDSRPGRTSPGQL